MILADHSIIRCLEADLIGCDPTPTPEQVQPASLDIRLGDEIRCISTGDVWKGEEVELIPGERYLGHTKERIELPKDLAAQLAGRSTIGRRGIIIHKTAGWIDPGFEGEITLELMNLGTKKATITPGERVGQLVFLQLDCKSSGYDGRYQGQEGATEAR